MRGHRRALIFQLPPRRVWLYLRQQRVMLRLDSSHSSTHPDLFHFIVTNSNSELEDETNNG
jgi:hypothetical protein